MQHFTEYPCPNCGAELNYDADATCLKCNHCQTKVEIARSTEILKENSLGELRTAAQEQFNQPVEVLVYRCSKCGKENNLNNNVAVTECSHCGYNASNPSAYSKQVFNPKGVLPFEISKREVGDIYEEWIKKGFFAPDNLKKENILDKLEGVFLPFWTFDAQTTANWQGYGGEYYYVSVQTKNAQGQTVTTQEQRTRWHFRTGTVNHFFNDILICGTGQISQQDCAALFPFRLDKILPFDAKFMLGWHETPATRSADDCLEISKHIIYQDLESRCARECTIHTYRGLTMQIYYSNETYKHVLLPVWFCNYWYKNKQYNFFVNGQTGKINGTKPVAAAKVALVVVLALLIIFLIYMFYSQSG